MDWLNNVESIGNVLHISSIAMIVTAIPTFIALMYVKAPYGRHAQSDLAKWSGPIIPARLGWVIMESTNLVIVILVALFFYDIQFDGAGANEVALSCFILHYFNRALIFPFRMRNPTPMTFLIFLCSSAFCTWNSLNQSFSLLVVHRIPEEWETNIQLYIGIILFMSGFLINIYGDTVLMNLRKVTDPPGTYKIPSGGLYEYISCPNYFGEIIEWFGFCMISHYSLASIAFVIYTISNLAPRALKVYM